MEIEGVFQLKGFIQDFFLWDNTINSYAVKFHEKYNVYPNILVACEDTYKKIDLYAQKKPDMLIAPDGKNIYTSDEQYEEISYFVTIDYTLECCFDFDLTVGNFYLNI